MAAMTQPVGSRPTRPASETAVREWLNALAEGECNQAEFLQAMRRRFAADQDGTWEVLSLLDQYYRRGKIRSELFHAINTSLAGSAMGAGKQATLGTDPLTNAAVTIPATAAHAGAAPSTPVMTSPAAAPAAAAGPVPALEPTNSGRAIRVGDVLRGRYRIAAVLGAGGMGTVFEAIDAERLDLVTSDQRIAVKVLHTAVTHRAELLDELRREFQNLQVLSHPNIVRVYEFDRDGPIAFFTMELIRGVLLSQALTARNDLPLPRAQALAVIRDVGAALAHAHSRGVVHGDVNPQNIFLTQSRDVRVMDFGASYRLIGGPLTADSELGFVPFATPGYASCQLQEGAQPDARDDVFAFACVAYLLLSGKHPFAQHSAIEARALGLRPRRPANLTGPQWRALKAGLRWKRETRPGDVAQWLERFEFTGAAKRLDPLPSLLEPPRLKKRRYLLAAALLVLFVVLAGLGYWAVTDFDSLSRTVDTWSARQQPAVVDPAPVQPLPDAEPSIPPPPVVRAMPPPPKPSVNTPATSAAPAPVTASPRANSTPAAETPPSATTAGTTRVELTADTIDVPADAGVALVNLRRRGNLRKEATFAWWTESGTAKPGVDFASVAKRVETLAAGQATLTLNVPLTPTVRAQPKSFYVVIDAVEDGTAMGSKTLTMVTLQPGETAN